MAFSHWIWGAWLETAQDCRFIYGCSAPCTRAPGWQDVARDKELLGAKLTIREATVEEPRFRSFADHLAAGKIELGLVFGTKSSALNIAETRHVLEAGLGQTAARVTAHYTQPDLAELTGNDDSRLPLLLGCGAELIRYSRKYVEMKCSAIRLTPGNGAPNVCGLRRP